MNILEILVALGIFEATKRIILAPIDERFAKRKATIKENRKLSDQIREVCSEGQDSVWRKEPESSRHIQDLVNKSLAIDERLSAYLMELLVRWKWRSTRPKNEYDKHSDEDERKILRELSNTIVRLANNLKK